MMIQWLEDAVDDLRQLRQYIAQDNPDAASRIASRVIRAVGHLAKHPGMGRSGRVLDTRELIIPNMPYIIPYRVKNNTVEILRVFHSAMQWPEAF